MLSPAILATILAATPAQAGGDPGHPFPLGWRWYEGLERTWQIDTHVVLAQATRFRSAAGAAVSVPAFDMSLLASCVQAEEVDASTVRLRCDLEDVVLSPLDAADPEAEAVFTELETRLSQAFAIVEQDADGRIRGFEMRGVSWWDIDSAESRSIMEEVLHQAFVGLDLEVPSRARLGRSWVQRSPLLIEDTAVHHRVDDYDGERALIASRSLDEAHMAGGSALFDLEAGALVERQWWTSAVTEDGAVSAQSGQLRMLDRAEVAELRREHDALLAEDARDALR